MKIIISPAKKLTTEKINVNNPSSIQFLAEVDYLVDDTLIKLIILRKNTT